jgi:hypothetical protein
VSIAPPPIKRPPLKNKHKVPIIVAGITTIGVVLVALIPVMVYQLSKPAPVTPSPVPSSTSPVPGPIPPPTPVSIPSPTPTFPDPTGVTVRRSTGDHPLALSESYSADLDSMNPGWDVKYAATMSRFDISYAREGWLHGRSSSDLAIVSATASYDVCSTATSYRPSLDIDEVKKGINMCVRTSEKRFAFMTIKKLVGGDHPNEIQLDVTVWDPPFEE